MLLSLSRQAKVQHFNVTVLAQHHVFRFHIAMDYAGLMRRLQGASNLNCSFQRVIDRQWTRFDPFAQSQSIDVLSCNEWRRVVMIDFVDSENVWMVQPRGGAGFLDEATHPRRVIREFRGQNLQGQDALEFDVDCLIDLAHSAGADVGADFVVVKPGAGGQSHVGKIACRAKASLVHEQQKSTKLSLASGPGGVKPVLKGDGPYPKLLFVRFRVCDIYCDVVDRSRPRQSTIHENTRNNTNLRVRTATVKSTKAYVW